MIRSFARVVAILLLLLGGWLVFGFEANLHCTQSTSFALATFDPEPHVEELDGGAPAVYGSLLALPLRVYLALSLLALLLVPAEGAFLVLDGRLGFRNWLASALGLTVLVCANSALPEKLIGERFQAFGWIAVAVVAVPLCALAALLLRESDRRVGDAPTVFTRPVRARGLGTSSLRPGRGDRGIRSRRRQKIAKLATNH